MRKINLLFCSSTFEGMTHGPSKFMYNLYHYIKRLPNYEIKVITRDISQSSQDIIKLSEQYPSLLATFWEYYDSYYFFKEIQKLDFEPDGIIFINAILGYHTASNNNKKAKLIGFINDYEKLENGNQYPWYSRERYHRKKSRFLERKAVKELDYIIACSDFLKNKIEKEYKTEHSKIKRLYQGINPKQFVFREHKCIAKQNTINILFVKSNFIIGNLRMLIKALSDLSIYQFNLIVCGHIQDKNFVKSISKSVNLNIQFKGKTTQNDIIDLMHKADIFCTPSLREGLGVANVEALATGLPVVSSDAGGIPEIMNYGKNGFMSLAGNIDSLKNAIATCINNRDLRIKHSKLGRLWVEKNFNEEEIFKEFLTFLSKVIH